MTPPLLPLLPLRLAFMGSPEFALPSLRALADAGHEIAAVYAQPPRPAGRGHKERPCPVHALALERVIVVDVSAQDDERAPLRMANPELIEVSEADVNYEEGCLSLPEHYAEVVRPAEVKLRYLDHENEICELDAEGLLGTCIQHEMDHLDGILFVDHLSALKRNMILRKLTKFKKAEAKGPDKAPTRASAAAE